MTQTKPNYAVQLWTVHDDGTQSLATVSTNLDARRSLKCFRELCAIGRAYVRDGEWHRWQADRISGDSIQTIIGAPLQ